MIVGEPDKDDEGGDEHDETLSPQEKQLKDLIAQTLNLHVQNLKVLSMYVPPTIIQYLIVGCRDGTEC